jgi:DNA-binding NarL/FixJ family response regulator
MAEGIRNVIERATDLELAGTAGSTGEALDAILGKEPDVVVSDLALPDGSGLELMKRVQTASPEQRFVILSVYAESVYAERALRAGASGYVMKEAASETLLEAVRTVLRGDMYISPALRERLVQRLIAAPGRKPDQDQLDLLSDRELEVYRMIGTGYSRSEIAEALHISPKTVESYRAKIKEKMGFRNASEMMQHAVAWRLDQPRGESAEAMNGNAPATHGR